MDHVDAPRRASFGSSLLVALGWYATGIAAVVVGWSGGTGCTGPGLLGGVQLPDTA